jgi:hypothetical protein
MGLLWVGLLLLVNRLLRLLVNLRLLLLLVDDLHLRLRGATLHNHNRPLQHTHMRTGGIDEDQDKKQVAM